MPEWADQTEARLRDMDEAGIDMQVMNCVFPYDAALSPAEAVDKARGLNEALAVQIEKYPDRFSGFAALPLQDPEEAAAELERAVSDLGLKGTMLFSDIGGAFLDEDRFQVVLATAEKLDVPIYLHPSQPRADMIKPYLTYPLLSSSMWGFAVEAGLHAMRLICSGTFDRFPRLQFILGHLGEAIPWWLWRIDNRWLKEKDGGPGAPEPDPNAVQLRKRPTEYFRENFYITTSGMFWPPNLQFAGTVLDTGRILFAVDYPQESNLVAARFIKETPISEADKEAICHGNAERLLGL
jgi:2,3-dihydroxybenzoate decarboxylase